MLVEHRWEEIAEYLAGVRRRRPAVGEVVDLHERLLRAQHAAAQALAAPAFDAGSDRLAERNRQGLPVVARGEFPIDLPAAAQLFGALLAALRESGAEAREQAVSLLNLYKVILKGEKIIRKDFLQQDFI